MTFLHRSIIKALKRLSTSQFIAVHERKKESAGQCNLSVYQSSHTPDKHCPEVWFGAWKPYPNYTEYGLASTVITNLFPGSGLAHEITDHLHQGCSMAYEIVDQTVLWDVFGRWVYGWTVTLVLHQPALSLWCLHLKLRISSIYFQLYIISSYLSSGGPGMWAYFLCW